ncbi:SRPBCC family protein [Desertivirga brevis]|uniref:SRPBCC family protein n=1 Tax=Desertivirga brevis TaxID=2810310 RepID=UPI001A958373|nr:SRPBCC domain-containing protein [Pedobacter sp. SYSU D00873]
MESQDFTTSITVEQSQEEVFNAINNVRGWWSQNIEGLTDRRNSEFRVNFHTHWWAFRITESVPFEKIEWLVTGSYMPWNKVKEEWTGTKVCFDIAREGDMSRITFTHLGLDPSFDCFEGCSKGWTGYIHQSLQPFIVTGIGTPDVAY